MTVEEQIQALEESVIDLLTELKKSKRRLLNEEEAADYLSAKASTLRVMRCNGKGPKYVKTEGLGVKYDIRDLDEYCNNLPRKGGGIL